MTLSKNMLVPDVAIAFELGERALRFAYRDVPFTAWAELKRATGFTPRTLLDAIEQWDLDAIVAVVWLERKQRERGLGYRSVYQELAGSADVSFQLTDLVVDGRSMIVADTDDMDPDGELDPTTPGTS